MTPALSASFALRVRCGGSNRHSNRGRSPEVGCGLQQRQTNASEPLEHKSGEPKYTTPLAKRMACSACASHTVFGGICCIKSLTLAIVLLASISDRCASGEVPWPSSLKVLGPIRSSLPRVITSCGSAATVVFSRSSFQPYEAVRNALAPVSRAHLVQSRFALSRSPLGSQGLSLLHLAAVSFFTFASFRSLQ